jgi:hypothetical protein
MHNTSLAEILKPIFEFIGVHGWNNASLYALSQTTDLGLADFHALFPNKAEILKKFGTMIDQKILSQFADNISDDPHDALFDMLMTRFELMTPYKKGVLAIYNDTIGHLSLDLIKTLPYILQSLTWMGSLIPKQNYDAFKKFPTLKLSYLYFQTTRTWLWDETDELSLTMVEIDERLKEIEQFSARPSIFSFVTKFFK